VFFIHSSSATQGKHIQMTASKLFNCWLMFSLGVWDILCPHHTTTHTYNTAKTVKTTTTTITITAIVTTNNHTTAHKLMYSHYPGYSYLLHAPRGIWQVGSIRNWVYIAYRPSEEGHLQPTPKTTIQHAQQHPLNTPQTKNSMTWQINPSINTNIIHAHKAATNTIWPTLSTPATIISDWHILSKLNQGLSPRLITKAYCINIIHRTVNKSKSFNEKRPMLWLGVSDISHPHFTSQIKLYYNITSLPPNHLIHHSRLLLPPHPSPQEAVLTLSWIFGSAPFSSRYFTASILLFLHAQRRGVSPAYTRHHTTITTTEMTTKAITVRQATSYHDKSILLSPQTHKTTTIHARMATSNTIKLH
jgi:hypothetical protein